MPYPSALSTDIGTVLRFVACTTRRAFLRSVGRVYLLYLDAESLCFVGDEGRQLVEAPTILHAVVFAGRCPTTCTCRALAHPCKGLDFDGIASTKTKSKGFPPAARAFHPPRGSAGVDLPVFCKDML